MSVKDVVKKTWPFDKAEKIKNLYFEKLDEILSSAREREATLDSLSANDTSILQALVHLVVAVREEGAELAPLQPALDALRPELAAIRTATEVVRPELEAMRSRLEGVRSELAAFRAELGRVRDAATRQPGYSEVQAGDEQEPELGLVEHLAPLLPLKVALDVGANVGKYSEALLAAGFQVHAFEPNPHVVEPLRQRLGGRDAFTAHAVALGAEDGTLTLNLLRDSSPERYWGDTSELATLTRHALPDTLAYEGAIEVPVRSLESLRREGAIPAEVGYLKVDTEGFDLEVVRGMGALRPPLVSVEFWGKELPFAGGGALNALPDLAAALRPRGYPWWIAISRDFPDHTARYSCNAATATAHAWGNAFFFRDHALFAEAERWCAAVLPRIYFTATRLRPAVPVRTA